MNDQRLRMLVRQKKDEQARHYACRLIREAPAARLASSSVREALVLLLEPKKHGRPNAYAKRAMLAATIDRFLGDGPPSNGKPHRKGELEAAYAKAVEEHGCTRDEAKTAWARKTGFRTYFEEERQAHADGPEHVGHGPYPPGGVGVVSGSGSKDE